MVGGAVSSKTMREAALYLTGFQRRDTYEVSIELTPEVAPSGCDGAPITWCR